MSSDAESSFGTTAIVSVDVAIASCFFAIGCDDFGVPIAVAAGLIDVSAAMSFVTFLTATDNDGETDGEGNVNEIIM